MEEECIILEQQAGSSDTGASAKWAKSQGLTTSASGRRWMRVATAEGPDGLFLYYMAFSIHTVKQYFESVAKKKINQYILEIRS